MPRYRLNSALRKWEVFDAASDAAALAYVRRRWPSHEKSWLQKLARNGGWNWLPSEPVKLPEKKKAI